MKLHLIWAQARNGVIGNNGTLPWHLPEDMAHFKALTLGCPVIMGRKTWDSLPAKFRPLPGRRNLVLTRSRAWHEPGVEAFENLEQALQGCALSDLVWVIGGADVYRQALPLAHVAHVTEIDADFQGDAFAPRLDAQWIKTVGIPQTSRNGMAFSFNRYHHPSGI